MNHYISINHDSFKIYITLTIRDDASIQNIIADNVTIIFNIICL